MKSNVIYLRTFLILLVLTNVFLGYKVIKGRYFKYDPDYTFDRKDLFEQLNVDIDSNSIVFVGNSLTQQFELAELFKKINIRNRGINGDKSAGILARLDDITRYHPEKIFIENGVNDIKDGLPKDILLEHFKEILIRIRKESPSSRIYVQSLLPVNSQGAAVATSKLKNETIRDVNKGLQEYCSSCNVTFINLYDHFELNGEINPKYCIADGLHISGDGYLLWTKLLKPYVDE